jgi:hypothetical protein
MQIAFEPSPGIIAGRHGPGPGRGELPVGFGVDDRGRGEVGKDRDAGLCVGGRGSGRDEPTMAAPHGRRPCTMIGASTVVRMPRFRENRLTTGGFVNPGSSRQASMTVEPSGW